MMSRFYLLIFFIISTFLGFQWLILNDLIPNKYDLFNFIPSLKDLNRSTVPGRPISLYLGYAGITLMCMMNIYSMRKRFSFMAKWGNKERYLDFHIFCGLLGPVLIIFHANFKVGGLVAISFWSMIISASSGIIGKVIYSQILNKRSSLINKADAIESKLIEFNLKLDQHAKTNGKDKIDHNKLKRKFLSKVGISKADHEYHDASVIAAIYNLIVIPFTFRLASVPFKKRGLSQK